MNIFSSNYDFILSQCSPKSYSVPAPSMVEPVYGWPLRCLLDCSSYPNLHPSKLKFCEPNLNFEK